MVANGVLVINQAYGIDLVALDAETGVQLWQFPEADGWPSIPTIANGLVYFATSNQNGTHAFDLYTGAQVWSGTGPASWSPLVAEHRYFMASEDDIKTLNASTGALDWSKLYGYNNLIGAAPAYSLGMVYLSGPTFRAINPRTGGTVWSLVVADFQRFNPAVVVSENKAIVGKTDYSQFIAIDLNTHNILWTKDGLNLYGSANWSAVADGAVYAVNEQLNVFDLANGNMLWSFVGDGQLDWNPVVTQKYVYVASYHNTYVVDRITHQVVWQTNVGGYLTVANGFLYIATNDTNPELRAYRARIP
jgi:outer membrane protein assembly factor BamB